MIRRTRFALLGAPLAVIAAGLVAAGCGGEIEVPEEQRSLREGAELFSERCSGCHSLAAANAFGSKPPGQLEGGERTNGPNFNVREVRRDDALFAIRNGGFSGSIMPANIVVGRDANLVADFLAEYSGTKKSGGGIGGRGEQPTPERENPAPEPTP